MKNTLVFLGILIFLAFPVLGQAGKVYRWVDGQGKVHFSDQPGGMNSQAVEVKPIPRSEPMPGGRETSPRPQATASKPEAETATAKEDAKKTAKLRSKNCEIARDNLKRNESISRMYRLDENGERAFLTDAEREAVMEKSRRHVKEWCGT